MNLWHAWLGDKSAPHVALLWPPITSTLFSMQDRIDGFDNELREAVHGEEQRPEDHVELITLENYVSRRILEAQGSVLTIKYAELLSPASEDRSQTTRGLPCETGSSHASCH